jgi:sarcosine oxidase subunit beta
VETTAGRIETEIIVNAAGAHAPEIGALAGLDIPIRPRRGQLIVTEASPPMIDHCMISARYIAAKFNPDIAGTNDEGFSIEQTQTGQFLLGSTREFVGFNRQTTPDHLYRIAAKAVGIIPALTQVHAIRAFAGLRPYTPDGLPVLGPVAAVPGFFMAAGHEGDGIALSPITGDLIAQLITTGKTDISLDNFRLDRFTDRTKTGEAAHV